MKPFFTILAVLTISLSSFSQESKELKVCKYKYENFKELSINDTSDAVIDLFFRKKESAIYNQMSLLPFSIILVAVPTPAQVVGLGSFVISGPLFINGTYTLVRYRKKKLKKVLIEYKEQGTLPKWVKKRTDKLLNEYKLLQIDY